MSKTQMKLRGIRDLSLKAVALGALQKPLELSNLLDFLKGKSLKTVVEIGTARGGTFFALCQTADPNALIISIDLENGPFGGGYSKEDIKKFKTYKKGSQKLVFLQLDSHIESTRLKLQSVIGKREIDFLLIDGDHSYAGVKRDWDLYSPFVKENGIIAFHDIIPHPTVPSCQVFKLWQDIKDQYKHREFIDKTIDPAPWAGIGVIYYHKKSVEISSKGGILLCISPLLGKQKGFMGLGERKHPNVDIVHDLEDFPWPLKDNSCHMIIGQYVFQKIKPWLTVDFMNELWRILKPDGQLALSIPYAGSPGFYADPKNISFCTESTFCYFDPKFPGAYAFYEPKPWTIEKGFPQWITNGNLEILMRPRKNEKGKL